MKQTVTKAYTLYPIHISVISQVAKDNGQSSASAALRYIIDAWARSEQERKRYVITDPQFAEAGS